MSVLDFPLAVLMLPLFAHLTRDWAILHFVCGGIGFACCVPMIFAPESPRWLVSQKKTQEAYELFLDVAKTNGRELTDQDKSEIKEILEEVKNSCSEEHLNPFHMFKPGYLSRTLILFLSWSMASLGTYGLTLSSTRLAGDIVLNMFLLGLADIPVAPAVFLIIKYFGRTKALFVANMTLGISTIIVALVPKDQTTVVLIFYLFGKNG